MFAEFIWPKIQSNISYYYQCWPPCVLESGFIRARQNTWMLDRVKTLFTPPGAMGRWERLQSLPRSCHNLTVLRMSRFIMFRRCSDVSIQMCTVCFHWTDLIVLKIFSSVSSTTVRARGRMTKELLAKRWEQIVVIVASLSFLKLYLRSWFMTLQKSIRFLSSSELMWGGGTWELLSGAKTGSENSSQGSQRQAIGRTERERGEGFQRHSSSKSMVCLSSVEHKRSL